MEQGQLLVSADGGITMSEKGYGIFHCEGDEAVLEDITELLEKKGVKVSDGV